MTQLKHGVFPKSSGLLLGELRIPLFNWLYIVYSARLEVKTSLWNSHNAPLKISNDDWTHSVFNILNIQNHTHTDTFYGVILTYIVSDTPIADTISNLESRLLPLSSFYLRWVRVTLTTQVWTGLSALSEMQVAFLSKSCSPKAF